MVERDLTNYMTISLMELRDTVKIKCVVLGIKVSLLSYWPNQQRTVREGRVRVNYTLSHWLETRCSGLRVSWPVTEWICHVASRQPGKEVQEIHPSTLQQNQGLSPAKQATDWHQQLHTVIWRLRKDSIKNSEGWTLWIPQSCNPSIMKSGLCSSLSAL